ncbi:MAG TPA: aspartate--tRNA ligase [Vicinamibacterales bacterium]|nr:aspartate--tRNA ligase [Vicinamibacterales bacterium]
MAEQLGSLARTHTCGALRPADVGARVVLLGWVHRVRDLGSLVFLDIRDRHGLTQVIVEGQAALVERAKRLRSEYVVAVIGEAERRSAETVNLNVATGEVEVRAGEIRVLNEAKTPPFSIAEDQNVSEETRLRYRYLDLRRPQLQRNIGLRHRITLAIRRYFDEQGFYEIETPILTKSTPEGARDFLVPSRVHPGEFYALPQSPQLFKQILMIAGFDRYVQIARCFRDEALRADRQLEFTQVDLEMAFATPDLVFEIVEGALAACFREIGVEIPRPFRRMAYAEAMAKYGSDKPDLRFGLEIQDFGPLFAESAFGIFREAVSHGGTVRGFVIPGAAGYSRREVDSLVEQARQLGAAGLVWARFTAEGVQASVKAIGPEGTRHVLEAAGTTPADLLVLASGAPDEVSKLLGQLRLQVARQANLIPDGAWELTWITDFPLFDWNPAEKRWDSVNHPFTAPREEDLHLLEANPGVVLARAYDVILNGWELGGGSIRIHDRETQAKVFRLLGLSDEDARHRFGFFLESLEYGTPPHGGLALGLDRICALLSGETSIREVIPFPKTTQAVDLMCDAPSTVDPRQLRELNIKVTS